MKDIDDFLLPDKAPEMPDAPGPRLDSATPDIAFERGLPASIDTERSILGAILLDNKAFHEANEALEVDDFALDSHRRIFSRMKAMIEVQQSVDIVTLSNELARKKEIQAIGGVAYLASLTEGLPRRVSIQDYVRIVADKSILRQLINKCSSAITRAADQSEYGMDLVSETNTALLDIAARTKSAWRLRPKRDFIVGAREFVGSSRGEVEWTVHGIIQRGGNGLIVGDPGTSKSLLALHLLLHLVAGRSWFGHAILRRTRCALVSREDHPGLTQQRLLKLVDGLDAEVNEELEQIDLHDWLYFNTRAQTETFALDKETDVIELIESFKEKGIEFAVFDVFRTLWSGNENDAQEAQRVLDALRRIQSECNCSVALIHHLSKGDGPIFSRIRGTTGIYGWREWAFGLTIENPEAEEKDWIRKSIFYTKAGAAANSLYYQIEGFANKTCLTSCNAPQQYKSTKKKKQEPDLADGKSNAGGLF